MTKIPEEALVPLIAQMQQMNDQMKLLAEEQRIRDSILARTLNTLRSSLRRNHRRRRPKLVQP